MEARVPYPGLRPFDRTESDIFFGREEQTDELLRRLNDSRLLAVIGPSGCGKSSLVRAGMIAALETGYMAKAGAHWRVAIMRPGSACFRNLASALLETLPAQGSDAGLSAAFLESTLARGPLGLVEAVRETGLPQGENLLIVVDQFEEIFRFRREREDDVLLVHLADADPDVRGNPVPLRVGSDDGDAVLRPEEPLEVKGSSVP